MKGSKKFMVIFLPASKEIGLQSKPDLGAIKLGASTRTVGRPLPFSAICKSDLQVILFIIFNFQNGDIRFRAVSESAIVNSTEIYSNNKTTAISNRRMTFQIKVPNIQSFSRTASH